MSEEINNEVVVDELSKPGNEADLEKALQSDFDAAGQDPAGPDDGQNKDLDIIPNTDKPAENQIKPDEADKGAEPLKQNEADIENNKGDRFKELLQDRNKARGEAAANQTESQILSKEVENLTALVKTLQQKGEGGDQGDQPADEPLTTKGVSELMNKILDERESGNVAKQDAEKSDTNEVNALLSNQDYGEVAKPYESKIREIMQAHPTISAIAALAMAQGFEALSGGNAAPVSNANKTHIGNRTKTNLRRDVKPSDMKDTDMEKYLRGEEAKGTLKV